MSEVDTLLQEFIAEHKAGGAADPRAYLSRVEGLDRRELAALIDAYLVRAPRRAWDREAYERSSAPETVERLSRSIRGSAGLWPSLLPRLRERAQIKRGDLVAELAHRLGAQQQREKVEVYFHQMEQGLLPSAGVSDQVLEALGRILGTSRDALRRAGEEFGAGPTEGAPGAAFARTAQAAPEEPAPAAAGAPARPSPEEWDQVDRLFRAGR